MRWIVFCLLPCGVLSCTRSSTPADDCAAGASCAGEIACGDDGAPQTCISPQGAAGDEPAVSEPTDPCAEDNGGCAPLVSCSGESGSALCGSCPDGYTGDGQGKRGCTDIDECQAGAHACKAPEACMNLPGSFRCGPCAPGTLLHGAACVPRWTLALASSGDDHVRAIAIDVDDQLLIAGSTTGVLEDADDSGAQDAFIAKFDPSGERVYVHQFGTTQDEIVTDVVVDPDGNAYVLGSTEGRFAGNDAAGGFDLFIAKLNGQGDVQWIRQFGSAADDSSGGAGFDAGALYVTGFTEGELPGGGGSAGSADGFVARYAPDGTRAWLRQFGGPDSDLGAGLSVDLSGNVFVTGESSGVLADGRNLGGADLIVLKYDADGEFQWAREAGTIGADSGFGLASVEAGNAYVVGSTGGALANAQTSAGRDDAFVIKYDASGSTHWTRQFGSGGSDVASAVAVDSFGGAWITGVAHGKLAADSEGSGLFLGKYDSAGMQKWTRQPAGMGAAVATDLALDTAGNGYVVGFSGEALDGRANEGGVDGFVLKFDARGERR